MTALVRAALVSSAKRACVEWSPAIVLFIKSSNCFCCCCCCVREELVEREVDSIGRDTDESPINERPEAVVRFISLLL